MPGPKDSLPDFVKGAPLTAEQLKQIVAQVRALMPMQPGGMVTGAFTVQRPMNLGEDAAASISGVLCSAVSSIAGATETTIGNLSAAVRALIDPGNVLQASAKVWIPGSGAVTMYSLYIELGGQFGQSVVGTRLAPTIKDGSPVIATGYNMARLAIAAGKILQGKSFKGTDGAEYVFIDVEPC